MAFSASKLFRRFLETTSDDQLWVFLWKLCKPVSYLAFPGPDPVIEVLWWHAELWDQWELSRFMLEGLGR